MLARVPRIDCHALGGLASPLERGAISTILGSLESAWEQGQLGGASRGREEAPEVGCSDREEATREAEATEEDLARQVTTAVNRGRLSPSGGNATVSLGRCALALETSGRAPRSGPASSEQPAAFEDRVGLFRGSPRVLNMKACAPRQEDVVPHGGDQPRVEGAIR